MEPKARIMAGVKVATIWRRDNPSTLLSAGEALQLQWRQPGIIPLANSLACAVYYQGMSITKECLLPRNVYYQGMSITKECLLPRNVYYQGMSITKECLLP